ncbi:ACT domain-containing protein [Dechloromonas sp. ZS-1]|uniref:ACT domain-containing protein n=1 Tax=Dechloromonas sp. ZS-1 TaxID=3138067 RepID=UPI0031FD61E6
MSGITDLATLLRSMTPALNAGEYCFATLPPDHPLPLTACIATLLEREGRSVVLSTEDAAQWQLAAQFPCAWITLTVHSALHAVGLTAAVSHALAEAGIACNVVAGNCHDHLFVPYAAAERAMHILNRLAETA